MGVFSGYLERNMSFDDLLKERKLMLQKIAQIRGRDLIVYAADVMKAQQGAPVALTYDDILSVQDQLDNLAGTSLDVILETGGGSGEVAEDIVKIIRSRYQSVAFIVSGIAKSAGTIMVMSGDEILMGAGSALGPIDAQIQFEGKQFSAEALLKYFDKIKAESSETNSLNRAYIPLLQRISPGDLQHAQNALDFARVLVRNWLQQYKFQNWNTHRTHGAGTPVSPEEKQTRADEIARQLCDHSRWLTHGRSISMDQLRSLGLEVTDYSAIPELGEYIKRYHVLLRMTFDSSNAYKIVETPTSQVMRLLQIQQAFMPMQFPMPPGVPGLPGVHPEQPQPIPGEAKKLEGLFTQVPCPRCQIVHRLQADFDRIKPLQPGVKRFPADDILRCDCGNQINVVGLRQQLEMQTKRHIAREANASASGR